MTLFKHHDRLPTGPALIDEAKRLGVSLEGLLPRMSDREAVRRNMFGADPDDRVK